MKTAPRGFKVSGHETLGQSFKNVVCVCVSLCPAIIVHVTDKVTACFTYPNAMYQP